jgi:hypothetical protein
MRKALIEAILLFAVGLFMLWLTPGCAPTPEPEPSPSPAVVNDHWKALIADEAAMAAIGGTIAVPMPQPVPSPDDNSGSSLVGSKQPPPQPPTHKDLPIPAPGDARGASDGETQRSGCAGGACDYSPRRGLFGRWR